ncbi:MAG: mechanosensitive ion channel family protein [Acholeplasmataceae bacterium]|jgi:small conductance mechanosensitive channel|nr:mechanosensitive ion channel family protein [Acholeplasmataceae bacterium]
MLNKLFFASIGLNITLTAITIIVVALILIFENRLIKKNEDTLKKWIIILIYFLSFLLLIGSIAFLLYVWNFDFIAYVITTWDDIIVGLGESVGRIISSLVVLFIALLILRIAKITLKRIGQKPGPNQRRKRTVARVIRSIIRYTVGILSILIILAIWGVNVAPALAGLGILGLVIGLGAQKFINDLIAGFFIIFEHHFDVGDKVEVKGFKGEVIDIGLKTTRIKNWKNEILILSNGEITSLINFSKDYSIAVVEFGIAYQEDMQKTIEILNSELPKIRKDFPEIVEDPKIIGVTNLNSSSVDMRATCKTLNEQHYGVERAIRQRIKEILDENKIEIPFPQVVVNQPNKK